MLTANHENAFSGGCYTPDIGLSLKGKELLRNISGVNMMLDLAHISERSYYEILGIYDSPVIVSHANVKALSAHQRNLSDEQLKMLRDHNGIIGLCLISLFLERDTIHRNTSATTYHVYLSGRN